MGHRNRSRSRGRNRWGTAVVALSLSIEQCQSLGHCALERIPAHCRYLRGAGGFDEAEVRTEPENK